MLGLVLVASAQAAGLPTPLGQPVGWRSQLPTMAVGGAVAPAMRPALQTSPELTTQVAVAQFNPASARQANRVGVNAAYAQPSHRHSGQPAKAQRNRLVQQRLKPLQLFAFAKAHKTHRKKPLDPSATGILGVKLMFAGMLVGFGWVALGSYFFKILDFFAITSLAASYLMIPIVIAAQVCFSVLLIGFTLLLISLRQRKEAQSAKQ